MLATIQRIEGSSPAVVQLRYLFEMECEIIKKCSFQDFKIEISIATYVGKYYMSSIDAVNLHEGYI